MTWAKDRLALTVEIVKRSDDAKGFVVLPRRWVVERNGDLLGPGPWSVAVRDAERGLAQWALAYERRHRHRGRPARPHLTRPDPARPPAAHSPRARRPWLRLRAPA
ncbi:hypothetical protein [Actinacidiphila oryziradicis]|uniref:hypothetical protein n=1 Tax=Actinacidiphila oryziradicis TaxID=2571141 RepID=UPI001B809FE1|nr:hypothetical protein [Actinacidiphila oryziradicis]